MNDTTTIQKTIFLRLGENYACLADRIRAADWDVYVATNFNSALALCARYGIKVGLILAGGAQGEAQREEVNSFANSAYGIKWIALMDANSLRRKEFRALIGDYFYDYHTLPVDLSRLLTTLGHAAGMAELISKQRISNHSTDESIDLRSQTLASARGATEKIIIEQTLTLAGNNLSETARRLGISRPTLYRLLSKYWPGLMFPWRLDPRNVQARAGTCKED